jgi:orotate phosphoribosyltransferase
MTQDEILAEFRSVDALLEGHFILSSGRRSAAYLQCARILMDASRAARLAEALAAKLPAKLRDQVETVVSPAMGGVIIGHEMGRALGKQAMFLERPTGEFRLRRGFALEPGAKVLMVEDVVTTGLSSREAIAAVEREVSADRLGPRLAGTPKGDIRHLVPPADAVARMDEAVRPALLLYPRFGHAPEIRLMATDENFIRLTQATTNYDALGEAGFAALARLATDVPALAVDFEDGEAGLAEVERLWAAEARPGEAGR